MGPAVRPQSEFQQLVADPECEGEEELPRAQWPRHGAWAAVVCLGAVLMVVIWRRSGPTAGVRGRNVVELSAEYECFKGGAEELELDLPAFDNKHVTVPKEPASASDYKYASDSALVALPEKCYREFKADILKNTTLTDRGGTTGMVYLYISDLRGGFDTLAKMSGKCACGLVLEMHGSGGPGWSAVDFAILFSRMGMIEVVLNSMAMPDEIGLKGKLPLKDIDNIDVSNYCGEFLAFDGSCSKFSKPFCYSTKAENVLNDPTSYRKYVEGIYSIRKREMDYFVANHQPLLRAFDKVYLVGNSEGAMAAARYHHEALDDKLSGRILSAWSCEFNYYVSCPQNAKLCEDKCAKDVPQLNLIGGQDEYFSTKESSVSSIVAKAANGYGGPLTGSCRAQYDAQHFTKATAVVQEDCWHGPQYYDDNTWRNVIADFLAHAGEGAVEGTWASLKGCTLEADGAWLCPKDGPTTCGTFDGKYQVNPSATFHETSVFTCSTPAQQ